MSTHSSIPAWKLLWTEEPGGLQFMGSKELDVTEHWACTRTYAEQSSGKLCSTGIICTAAAAAAAAVAKSLQSCLTLCDPIDGSPPGSLPPWDSPGKNTGVGCHFLLQWWKWKVKVKSLNRVWLLATPWTAAYQALPSMGFSRQEHWSRVSLPSPRIFNNLYQSSHRRQPKILDQIIF